VNEPSSTFYIFLLCIVTLVAQFHAHESFFLVVGSPPPKQAFQLTVSVNRQLFVLTTSQLGCAINRKDKKVKQEELCWS